MPPCPSSSHPQDRQVPQTTTPATPPSPAPPRPVAPPNRQAVHPPSLPSPSHTGMCPPPRNATDMPGSLQEFLRRIACYHASLNPSSVLQTPLPHGPTTSTCQHSRYN